VEVEGSNWKDIGIQSYSKRR